MEKIKREELSQQLRIEIDAIVANAVPGKRGGRQALEANAPHYVSLYLASTCVNNKEPSVQDFKLFAGDAIGRRILVNRAALREIRVIIGAADGWRRQTLDAATQHCLQPYLYPESVTDGVPAVELYLASQLPLLAPLEKAEFEAQVRERAGEWFDETDQQQPYISWLCGSTC